MLCGSGSHYFKVMFTSAFKDKDMKEILLPEKNYEHMLDLMNIIHKHPCLDEPFTITGNYNKCRDLILIFQFKKSLMQSTNMTKPLISLIVAAQI